MSDAGYTVRWLVPDDAEQIAALEARVHVSEHRAGRQLIHEQLEAMEGDGRNLSLGLYRGSRLVGFGLAFVMADRRDMASFFDAPLPAGVDPDQSTIYIADWVVEPEHRRATKLMSARFAEIVRDREDLRNLPADAFATEEYARKWSAPSAYFAKLGWRFTGSHAFQDARLGRTLYWLCFDRTASDPPPSRRLKLLGAAGCDSTSWEELRPHWNTLLARTPQATALQSWEYLHTWYRHLGAIEQPSPIAVSRGGEVVAIAPLQVASVWQRGRHCRTLCWPGGTDEAQVSRALLADGDETAAEALASAIQQGCPTWEALELDIHPSQATLARHLDSHLRQERYSTSLRAGRTEHRVEVQGDWQGYLESRPETLRKRLQSAHARLATDGRLEFEMRAVRTLASLEEYFDLEHSAPDDEIGTGACASSRHMSFYRALVSLHGEALGIHAGYLLSAGRRAAGLLAFLWCGQLHLVHVTRPEAFANSDARYLALARAIEWGFGPGQCRTIDLTALDAVDPGSWATSAVTCSRLRARKGALSRWISGVTERLT